MSKKLKIDPNTTLDLLRMIDSRVLINANSGGGKSYLLRLIAEQTAGEAQVIILDPEGEFSTLREKFDFLLVGASGEIPTEVRSAALLARKLLELQASAIVDLYDLKLYERRKFVRLFLESLMSSPKSLWHPCVIMLDEAHFFAPERSAGDAESAQAVIDLMSQGRKRSYCGVLATQRLSKLHKDAEAEANTIFIGRTWLDIDQERAGKLLGFGKERRQELRDLPAGSFFAFGPALSESGVSRLQINPVTTSHPKAGQRHKLTPPKPSEAVKRIVASLADLPQQAEAEIRDMEAARKKIRELEHQLKTQPVPAKTQTVVQSDPKQEKQLQYAQQALREAIDVLGGFQSVGDGVASFTKQIEGTLRHINTSQAVYRKEVEKLCKHLGQIVKGVKIAPNPTVGSPIQLTTVYKTPVQSNGKWEKKTSFTEISTLQNENIGKTERRILASLAWWRQAGIPSPTREQVAFVAGYTVNGHFNNTIGSMRTGGMIEYPAQGLLGTTPDFQSLSFSDGSDAATLSDMLDRVEKVLKDSARRKLFNVLADEAQAQGNDGEMTVETLADRAGYTVNGHFNNTKGSLRTLGVIKYPRPGSVALGAMFDPFITK